MGERITNDIEGDYISDEIRSGALVLQQTLLRVKRKSRYMILDDELDKNIRNLYNKGVVTRESIDDALAIIGVASQMIKMKEEQSNYEVEEEQIQPALLGAQFLLNSFTPVVTEVQSGRLLKALKKPLTVEGQFYMHRAFAQIGSSLIPHVVSDAA